MSLTLASYVPLACVTESPYVEGHTLTKFQFRMLHAALGCCTETAELGQRVVVAFGARALDRDRLQNIKEELGDVMWYAAIGLDALCDAHLIATAAEVPVLNVTEGHAFDDLVAYSGDLADVMKRAVYYGKDVDRERAAADLLQIVVRVRILASFVGLDFGAILAGNIAKLKARYGAKFDAFLATNRNLEAEMKALG